VSECFVDCNVLDLRNPVPEKWHFWHGRVKFEGLVPVLTGFGHGGNAAERLFLGRFLMPDPLVQDPASTQNYRQLRTFGEYKYFPPDEKMKTTVRMWPSYEELAIFLFATPIS